MGCTKASVYKGFRGALTVTSTFCYTKTMINYLTKQAYTGKNIDILMASGYQEGDSFLTFRQALKLDGVTSQTMKGLKKCATLMYVKEVEDKETGKIVKKPKYFSVFDANQILTRIKNKKAA